MGGGQPGGGMPAWSSNLTARGTIPGPGGLALADATSRFIAAFIDFLILGVIGYIVNTRFNVGPRRQLRVLRLRRHDEGAIAGEQPGYGRHHACRQRRVLHLPVVTHERQ